MHRAKTRSVDIHVPMYMYKALDMYLLAHIYILDSTMELPIKDTPYQGHNTTNLYIKDKLSFSVFSTSKKRTPPY